MQVHDVARNPFGLVRDHPLVPELHQVPGDESRCEPARTQRGDEQHGRVAAAASALPKGLLGSPDARLVANDVADGFAHEAVHLQDERNRVAFARQRVHELTRQRTEREGGVADIEIRRELTRERTVVERHLPGGRLESEVEGVDGPDVDRELDRDAKLGEAPRWPARARDEVPRGVLLPAQLPLWGEVQSVRLDARPRMRRGSQTDQVRPERRGLRVAVPADVLQEHAHAAAIYRAGSPPPTDQTNLYVRLPGRGP